jgi:gas vesicle protein
MNERTSYLTSGFYFLAGALAGAGAALLLAPQAGELTRAMMGRKLRDTADSARQLKDRVVRRGEEIRDEAARRATDVAAALAGRGPRNGQEGKVASA